MDLNDLLNCKKYIHYPKTFTIFFPERGNVAITGGNVTVLKGEEILFRCLAVGWYPEPSLTWLVNGREVDQGQYNISTERPVDADGLYNLTSDLSVQAAESSHVECLASVSALPTPEASSVRLTVGEKHKRSLSLSLFLSTLSWGLSMSTYSSVKADGGELLLVMREITRKALQDRHEAFITIKVEQSVPNLSEVILHK